MTNLGNIGWPCTLNHLVKGKFLTATDFLLKLYILWEVTYYNNIPLQGLNSDVYGDYCLFYPIQRAWNVDTS